MAQVAPANGGAAGQAQQPPPNGQENEEALKRLLKETQHKLNEHNVTKTANAAHEQEKTTGDKAVKAARDKVDPALQQATELIDAEAEKVADKLSDEQVHGIEDAVDKVDSKLGELRAALKKSLDKVAGLVAAETTAKADATNAKAATAEAKRLLSERLRAIDQGAGRITSLVTEARTAIKQGQIPTAYLLLTDLRSARSRLEELGDEQEVAKLQQGVETAWTAEQSANAAEREATWQVTLARDAQQADQTALANYETDRRKTLDDAVQKVDDKNAAPGQAQQEAQAPAAQAGVAAVEILDVDQKDDIGENVENGEFLRGS